MIGAHLSFVSSLMQINLQQNLTHDILSYHIHMKKIPNPQVSMAFVLCWWQVYDMRFELNEVEARRENYPSTISFLRLINALIAEERNINDKGRRCLFFTNYFISRPSTLFKSNICFPLTGSWVSLSLFMRMSLVLFLKEPTLILRKNGSLHLPAWSISACE